MGVVSALPDRHLSAWKSKRLIRLGTPFIWDDPGNAKVPDVRDFGGVFLLVKLIQYHCGFVKF